MRVTRWLPFQYSFPDAHRIPWFHNHDNLGPTAWISASEIRALVDVLSGLFHYIYPSKPAPCSAEWRSWSWARIRARKSEGGEQNLFREFHTQHVQRLVHRGSGTQGNLRKTGVNIPSHFIPDKYVHHSSSDDTLKLAVRFLQGRLSHSYILQRLYSKTGKK